MSKRPQHFLTVREVCYKRALAPLGKCPWNKLPQALISLLALTVLNSVENTGEGDSLENEKLAQRSLDELLLSALPALENFPNPYAEIKQDLKRCLLS